MMAGWRGCLGGSACVGSNDLDRKPRWRRLLRRAHTVYPVEIAASDTFSTVDPEFDVEPVSAQKRDREIIGGLEADFPAFGG